MKYIVSNLKANFTLKDMEVYNKALSSIKTSLDVIVCPSYIYLNMLSDNVSIGAQDVSQFKKGAYTGEITAKQLASIGCKYVIVGHYERKKYFHDTNQVLIEKINNVIDNKMKVIYCIGESCTELKNNEVLASLEYQIESVLGSLDKETLANVIIAYEPKWAIGTNELPTTKAIINTVKYIKKYIKNKYRVELDVLYGGSINEDNIKNIKTIKEIDGIMIGASSLNVNSLISILNKL